MAIAVYTLVVVLGIAIMAIVHTVIRATKYDLTWRDVIEAHRDEFSSIPLHERTKTSRAFLDSHEDAQRRTAWRWRVQGIVVVYGVLVLAVLGACASFYLAQYSSEFYFTVVAAVGGVLVALFVIMLKSLRRISALRRAHVGPKRTPNPAVVE